jgi:FtsP/CotA-like multicopper oxidase with cupredoxin domain
MKTVPGRSREGISRRKFLRTGAVGAVGLTGLAPSLGLDRAAAAEPTPSITPGAPYVPRPNPTQIALQIATTTLNPDGKKDVAGITANGTFPGPEIRLRRGEEFRARVENALGDDATSIHWHGLLVPAGMDGVPGVSNGPIASGRVYVYEYPILQTGTYWYHSHWRLQEQIGLAGPLILEDPGANDEHDPVVMLSDWLHRSPYDVYAELRGEKPGAKSPDNMEMGAADRMGAMGTAGSTDAMPSATPAATKSAMPGMSVEMPSATRAGMGGMAGMGGGNAKADLSDVKYDAFLLNGKSTSAPWTYAAKRGQRIRLRIVNAGASTYFRLRLDGHPLLVTHADGIAVEPIEVDQILMGMAESYDAVVALSGSGSYTLHAVAQDGSGQAVGVLHTPDVEPQANLEMPKFDGRELSYTALRAIAPTTLPEGQARPFDLALQGDMARYVWMINGQAYPKADPLLIHRGDRVQVTMKNETMMWHPMHLHGHFFRVLQGGGDRCPLKHTVNVAPRETVRIEFIADNPGNWIFHCHNLYHFEAGMARVFEYEA